MASTGSRSVYAVTPSVEAIASMALTAADRVPAGAGAVGIVVAEGADPPASLGTTADRLATAGFDGSVGKVLAVPTAAGPMIVAVGGGPAGSLTAGGLRDAAAAFALVATGHGELALDISGATGLDPAAAAQAATEGALLARYRYEPLRSEASAATTPALSGFTVVVAAGDEAAAGEGVERGRAYAGATQLARDLANTPHSHLNATGMADLAVALAAERGLEVEVSGPEELAELGCGGLLGVNAGSVEPPRMIKLRYVPPQAPTARLTFVGKGLMYDSGGLALKPGDEVHAQMKNDMSGAAAVLAAMANLRALGCTSQVTAYLMCTDNMPSGTAMALGDVLTIRGGKTVEVINTDAEGRLVMADALVLATEEPVDAIVDIATLTGACMRALGTSVAGVMGNDQGLVDQVRAAAEATDEPVWQLPLERRYRKELDSTVADLRNLGGANAGAITAGLFLEEFVGGTPWAHVDIAGTAQTPTVAGWHTAGCSGFGARLLVQLALDLSVPGP
jgi:leucyl aminopeptidase